MPPLVSIVVNNYNYGRFLGEAIDSALAQTYPHAEVIVVDDGSTDNSRQVIAGYGDRIIPVLKENGGQGSAFNAGFESSKGELVLFLDSDDMLEPNAAEIVVREWRDGLARVFFPLRAIDTKGAFLGNLVGGARSPSPRVGPYYCSSPTSGNVFFREALGRIMPIPEDDWRICADVYTCAASLFGEVKRLEQPLARYRVHGDNNYFSGEELAAFRKSIHLDFALYGALFRLTHGDMKQLEDWLGTCPRHWVMRIKSLRESPNDHPWPDTFPGLTMRAVKATWRQPNRTFQQRLAYTAFVITYGLLPKGATSGARKLLRKIDGPQPGRTYRGLVGS